MIRPGAKVKFDNNREHPDYVVKRAMWRRYRDLYLGGEHFRLRVQDYLIRRQREPGDVYAERLSRVFYQNYIGSIVDWYTATLFRQEPLLTFEGPNEAGKKFFSELVEAVDRKKTLLNDFFRRVFNEGLITGGGYVLVDFPRAATLGGNQGRGRCVGRVAGVSGGLRGRRRHRIGASGMSSGNFEWVVIRTRVVKKDRVEDGDWRVEDAVVVPTTSRRSAFTPSALRTWGSRARRSWWMRERTGLAKLNQVPLFTLRMPEGLCILNRAGSLQLEHFNKSNALSWALTMGLFAMPVVYSDKEWSQMVGESYYIQLAPGDKFGWTRSPRARFFRSHKTT